MNTSALFPFTDPSANDLSLQDTEQLQIKLWQLVSYQSKRYTMGDSSSLRIETAEELFTSICFLLQLYQIETHIPWQKLLDSNFKELLKESRSLVKARIAQAKSLYARTQQSLPKIKNDFLEDTLTNIGIFFQKYDIYFFAHQIPCIIDYPLACPVPETLYGIEYILQYLQQLLIENHFLQCFPSMDLNCLLSVYIPDYESSLINLYEPVAINAWGHQLLVQTNNTLNISHQEKVLLQQRFQHLSSPELHVIAAASAKKLASELSLSTPIETDYLQHTIDSLIPRLKVALNAQNLNGIFMSW
jgi:hypothetical protein